MKRIKTGLLGNMVLTIQQHTNQQVEASVEIPSQHICYTGSFSEWTQAEKWVERTLRKVSYEIK